MHDETKAIHVPIRRSNASIAPAIELSTTFEHGPAGEHLHGFEYIRDDNPNVSDLESRLAAIEGEMERWRTQGGIVNTHVHRKLQLRPQHLDNEEKEKPRIAARQRNERNAGDRSR